MSMITIRPFESADLPAVIKLFKEAVASINIKHYSSEQIVIWTDIDSKNWEEKLVSNISLVAETDATIVGFADMTYQGYLDHMYINKDYQARWVSLKLLKAIESVARQLGLTRIITDCSITARIPAERAGFKVVKEQVREKQGVQFIVYYMEKKL
jgi:putative acetyltransferase